MKASSVVLSALAAATGAHAQNAAAVVSSVYQIGNYSTFLNSDVLNYNGSLEGLPWALQVQQDAVIIYRAINAGQAAVDASSAFDTDGSSQVLSAYQNITGTVKNTLTNTASKAAVFADLGPLVRVSLYQLKTAADSFANSTIKKLSSAEVSPATSAKADLDNAFNSAIESYGGKPLGD